jgi:hypothetical protein
LARKVKAPFSFLIAENIRNDGAPMAEVTFLGFGQRAGFDNKSITAIIGQEVVTGRAEVGPQSRVVFPPSSDVQSNLSNLRASSEVLRGGLAHSQSAYNQESAPFIPPIEHGQSAGIVRTYDPASVVLNPRNPLTNADTRVSFFNSGPLSPYSSAPESAGLDNLGNLRNVPVPYAFLNTIRTVYAFMGPRTINLADTAVGCAGLMLRFASDTYSPLLRNVRIQILLYTPATPSLTLVSDPPAVPTVFDTFVIEPYYTVSSIYSATEVRLSSAFATGYYQTAYNVQLPDLGARFTSFTPTAALRNFAVYPVAAFVGTKLSIYPTNLPAVPAVGVGGDVVELILPPVVRSTPNIEVILG